jgi:hypothetical protein
MGEQFWIRLGDFKHIWALKGGKGLYPHGCSDEFMGEIKDIRAKFLFYGRYSKHKGELAIPRQSST